VQVLCVLAKRSARAPAASLWRMACCLLSALSAVTACTSGGQLSNLGAAGEGETKWLKAKSASLIGSPEPSPTHLHAQNTEVASF
jgi:hypothetical protein